MDTVTIFFGHRHFIRFSKTVISKGLWCDNSRGKGFYTQLDNQTKCLNKLLKHYRFFRDRIEAQT